MPKISKKTSSNRKDKWDVLIVEDDLATRAELLKTLGSYAKCITVDDGRKALETYFLSAKNKKPTPKKWLRRFIKIMSAPNSMKPMKRSEKGFEKPRCKKFRIFSRLDA